MNFYYINSILFILVFRDFCDFNMCSSLELSIFSNMFVILFVRFGNIVEMRGNKRFFNICFCFWGGVVVNMVVVNGFCF